MKAKHEELLRKWREHGELQAAREELRQTLDDEQLGKVLYAIFLVWLVVTGFLIGFAARGLL